MLKLPYPPTTNNAYTIARGRKIKTDAARAYAQDVAACVLEHRRDLGCVPCLAGRRLAVRITAYPPDARRRDIANVEKLVVDAVFAALGLDDCQIDHLELLRGAIDRGDPHLTLELRAIG